jgi:hypothetical protein
LMSQYLRYSVDSASGFGPYTATMRA